MSTTPPTPAAPDPTTSTQTTSDGKWTVTTKTTITAVTPPVVPPVVPPIVPPVVPPVVPPKPSVLVIPANANYIDMLAKPPNPWQINHDSGTPGKATGTVTYPVTSPDGRPNCMLVKGILTDKGGIIMHGLFMKSGVSKVNRLVYKKREMIYKGAGEIACIETDLELTDKNKVPYDLAAQQDAHSGALDISSNHKWTPTTLKVNPLTRKNGEWHESEEYWAFDWTTKQITLLGVVLDGVETVLNKTFTDPDSSLWGVEEGNMQAQWDSNIAGDLPYEIYMDILGVATWSV